MGKKITIVRVDYTEKLRYCEWRLRAMTKDKQKDLVAGYAECKCSYHSNKKKRKASGDFDGDFDYFYGIVTTGEIFFTTVT
jgi:hypothetical protein